MSSDKSKTVKGGEKRHCASSSCEEGKHTYIVTSWLLGGGKQKAIQLRCRNCLMPLDLQEIESAEWSKAEGI